MTFWDFLDNNQGWCIIIFAVMYGWINYFGGIIEARKKDNPKWEKMK